VSRDRTDETGGTVVQLSGLIGGDRRTICQRKVLPY
jgi:hypothetical protein